MVWNGAYGAWPGIAVNEREYLYREPKSRGKSLSFFDPAFTPRSFPLLFRLCLYTLCHSLTFYYCLSESQVTLVNMGALSWLQNTRTLVAGNLNRRGSSSLDHLPADQNDSPTASSSGMTTIPAVELPFSGPTTPISEKDIKTNVDVDVEKIGINSSSDKGSDSQLHGEGLREADQKELTPMESARWDVSGDRSPFPEVQACVSTEDDMGLEVNSAF